MLVPEEIAEESASVAASAVITDNDENSRKRRRGRPFTKDKSVGTGPFQPSVNKAVQVIKSFFSNFMIIGEDSLVQTAPSIRVATFPKWPAK